MTQEQLKELRNSNHIQRDLTEILNSKTQGITDHRQLHTTVEDFGQFLKDNFAKQLHENIIEPRLEFLETYGNSTKEYHAKFGA